VDLAKVGFSDFHIDPVLARMRERQERLGRRVVERDDLGRLRKVAGLDVAYRGDQAFSAMAVLDIETGTVDIRLDRSQVRFPYIPSYLSFRELASLAPLVASSSDTLFLVDGQGVLHPRGLGIASHMGVELDVPTIGAAKSLLVGEVDPARPRSIVHKGRERGRVVGDGRRRLYISVGHRVSLETAEEMVRRYCLQADQSPLILAHRAAERAKREACD